MTRGHSLSLASGLHVSPKDGPAPAPTQLGQQHSADSLGSPPGSTFSHPRSRRPSRGVVYLEEKG